MASKVSKKAELVILLCSIQIGLLIILGVLLLHVKGEFAASSMLLGGLVGVSTDLFLAIKVFSVGVVPTSIFLRRYYLGHMLKLVLTAVMLALIFTLIKVDALYLILGLCVTQIVYLIILPFAKRL